MPSVGMKLPQAKRLFFDRQRGVTHCNAATLAMFGTTHEQQLRARVPWFPGMSPPLQADGTLQLRGSLAAGATRASYVGELCTP